MNRLNKTEFDVFLYCRFSLFLMDPFFSKLFVISIMENIRLISRTLLILILSCDCLCPVSLSCGALSFPMVNEYSRSCQLSLVLLKNRDHLSTLLLVELMFNQYLYIRRLYPSCQKSNTMDYLVPSVLEFLSYLYLRVCEFSVS